MPIVNFYIVLSTTGEHESMAIFNVTIVNDESLMLMNGLDIVLNSQKLLQTAPRGVEAYKLQAFYLTKLQKAGMAAVEIQSKAFSKHLGTATEADIIDQTQKVIRDLYLEEAKEDEFTEPYKEMIVDKWIDHFYTWMWIGLEMPTDRKIGERWFTECGSFKYRLHLLHKYFAEMNTLFEDVYV